ncbi:MAG: NUMOD1 domain-containing DNA-binding protein, partial [archaeon]
MDNQNKFVTIEKASSILDISVKFLKRCIIASIVNFKVVNDKILLDMTSVDNFIGIKAAASILSVSTRTVRRYTKKKSGKRLKSYRFNQKLCYQLSDIED